MIFHKKAQKLLVLLLTVLLTSCTSIGTRTLPKNHRGFNGAVINSTEEQLLLNIVRIQFEDRPFFLSVDSITTSNSLSVSGGPNFNYSPGSSGSLSGSLDGMGTTLSESVSNSFNLSKSFGFSPNASYSDSPTISYSPLQGEKFTRQMLTTISINTLYLLLDSGWNSERVMRSLLGAFADMDNVAVPSRHAIPDDRKFNELVKYLDELQQDKIIYYSIGLISSISNEREEEQPRPKKRYRRMSANTTVKIPVTTSIKPVIEAKNSSQFTKEHANKVGSSKL